MSQPSTIKCWIYKSSKQEEMYLYMPKKDAFEDIPAPLMKAMGAPELVMEVELSAEKKLARCDVQKVMQELIATGFYLQAPPNLVPHMVYGE